MTRSLVYTVEGVFLIAPGLGELIDSLSSNSSGARGNSSGGNQNSGGSLGSGPQTGGDSGIPNTPDTPEVPVDPEVPINPEVPNGGPGGSNPSGEIPNTNPSVLESGNVGGNGYGNGNGSGNPSIVEVNRGQQNKHIPGTNEYKTSGANRSIINGDLNDIQQMLDDFAGTGEMIGPNKERVDFGRVIGQYINPDTGVETDTTKGIIHYGNNGAHIVPARP